jgi:hypothetical protein
MITTRHSIVPAIFLLAASSACDNNRGSALFSQDEPLGHLARMSDKKLCIIVYARTETTISYPHIQFEVAAFVNSRIRRKVHVEIVSPTQVEDYQSRNLAWEAERPADLGAALGADMVLAINLVRFTTRDPHSRQLFHGQVEADCELIDCRAPPNREVAWIGNIEGTFPDKPVLVFQTTERVVRNRMLELIADKVTHELRTSGSA